MGHQRILSSTTAGLFGLLTMMPAGVVASDVPVIRVMFQNDAAAPSEIVDRAQAETSRLFRRIGLQIDWVSTVPAVGIRLRSVVLTTWEPSIERVPETALGYTQAGQNKRGTRGYIFWRRVEQASIRFTASLDRVLAIAIAHELGHMLLPDGAHARSGLMQAPWNPFHFRAASAGLLEFSPESAASMHRWLKRVDLYADGTKSK